MDFTSHPDQTKRLGSRARVALWLSAEIGQGAVFTKAQLRSAFPGVEQIDRRMRELRGQGWEILTRRDDPTLHPDELRLQTIGELVWQRSTPALKEVRPTPSTRREVLTRDDYVCQLCGVAAGDDLGSGSLAVARIQPSALGDQPNSTDPQSWISTCNECVKGGTVARLPISVWAARLAQMSRAEQDLLAVLLGESFQDLRATIAGHGMASEVGANAWREALRLARKQPLPRSSL